MKTKTIKTSNGKYYKIQVYDSGKHEAYYTGGFSKKKIGECRCIEDAIALIKVDSGSDIKSIA